MAEIKNFNNLMMHSIAMEYHNEAEVLSGLIERMDMLQKHLPDMFEPEKSEHYIERYIKLRSDFEKALELLCEIESNLKNYASLLEEAQCLHFPTKTGVRFVKNQNAASCDDNPSERSLSDDRVIEAAVGTEEGDTE